MASLSSILFEPPTPPMACLIIHPIHHSPRAISVIDESTSVGVSQILSFVPRALSLLSSLHPVLCSFGSGLSWLLRFHLVFDECGLLHHSTPARFCYMLQILSLLWHCVRKLLLLLYTTFFVPPTIAIPTLPTSRSRMCYITCVG